MTESRAWIVAVICLVGITAAALVPPVPQPASYHLFADTRGFAGIPNFADVVSNLPFLLVGVWGLVRADRVPREQRTGFVAFCAAVTLVTFGSCWYHLEPGNDTLVWDRLPIAAATMAIFACVIADTIAPRAGRMLLFPLIAAGMGAVLYWYATELAGAGDLRWYGLSQLLPIVLIPVLIGLYPYRRLRARLLWGMIGLYLLAKALEVFDARIFTALGVISGHTLKHLAAAGGAGLGVRAFMAGEMRKGETRAHA